MKKSARLLVGSIALAFMLCLVPSAFAERDDRPDEIERPEQSDWRSCEHGLPLGQCLRCRLDGKGQSRRKKGEGDGPFKEVRERHKEVMKELHDEIKELQKEIKEAVKEALNNMGDDETEREVVEAVFEQYESEAKALAQKIYDARETHAENMLKILQDKEDEMVEGGTRRILRGSIRKNRGRGRDKRDNKGKRRRGGPQGDDDDDDDEEDSRPSRRRGSREDFF